MNVSSTYLSHIDGFSDVDPNAISSKYTMYMLANTGNNSKLIKNGEPIKKFKKLYLLTRRKEPVDFTFPMDNGVKIKENKKINRQKLEYFQGRKKTGWRSYLPNPSARAGYDTRSIF